jgi:Mg2+ and Co2+ transporter CorA
VGFFGQNFSFLVGHIIGAGAFWLLGIGTEAIAIALTIWYFKVKGWF